MNLLAITISVITTVAISVRVSVIAMVGISGFSGSLATGESPDGLSNIAVVSFAKNGGSFINGGSLFSGSKIEKNNAMAQSHFTLTQFSLIKY